MLPALSGHIWFVATIWDGAVLDHVCRHGQPLPLSLCRRGYAFQEAGPGPSEAQSRMERKGHRTQV